MTPAVSKTLEIGIGILVIALLTSTFYGSVVPTYRTAAGQELADRAIARAALTTEAAVPPPGVTVNASGNASLPATIRGTTYEIHAAGTALELRHPHPRIAARIPLALPDRVAVTGTWRSTDPFAVSVTGNRSAVGLQIGGGS